MGQESSTEIIVKFEFIIARMIGRKKREIGKIRESIKQEG